jgi:hypothetical protein
LLENERFLSQGGINSNNDSFSHLPNVLVSDKNATKNRGGEGNFFSNTYDFKKLMFN